MDASSPHTYALRGLNPDRVQAISDYAGQSILDVGCGSGAYVLRFADERNIRGVDRMSFPSWQTRPELFALSNAEALPFADECVDTILSFEVLEHLPGHQRALKEYRRVARKNVIVTVPNCTLSDGLRKSNMLYSHWSDRTHVNFFDLDSICKSVAAAGFNVNVKRLINRISLVPLLAETTGVQIMNRRPLRPIVERLLRRKYYITCLVVGEKA